VAGPPVASERQQRWVVWMLAWVAGCVDAVGYLTLLRLFTAHLSGISVEAGIRAGEQDWVGLLERAAPVPLLVVGVVLGLVLTEVAGRMGARSPMALVVALEAALLVVPIVAGTALLGDGVVAAGSAWQLYVLAPPLVLAMGLQNATLRGVGPYAVRTTFITGMLTSVADELARRVFALYDERRGGPLAGRARATPRGLTLFGGIYAAFVLGAIAGGLGQQHWGVRTLAGPVGVLIAVVFLDRWRPCATRILQPPPR